MKTNLDYVNSYYKVNCKVGQKVTYQGKRGTIVHGMGHYVGVVMDGDKATNVLPYHPKDLEYLQEFTAPPRPTKAQQTVSRLFALRMQ